jgi:mannose-6-phosphate isomerase-like protein (cupin superfamily)
MSVVAREQSPRLPFGAEEVSDTGMRMAELGVPPGTPFNGSHWTVEPGGSSPVDVHAVDEIWMVASGEGELVYDGSERIPLRAGEVVHFAPMRSHEVINHGAVPLSVFSVWWQGG